jgi:LysM repeat protein
VIAVLAVAAVGTGLVIASLFGIWNAAIPPSTFVTAVARSVIAGTDMTLATPSGGNVTSEPTPAVLSPTTRETLTVAPTGSMPASAPTITAPTATALATGAEAPTTAPTATALTTGAEAPTTAPTITAVATDSAQETPFVEYVVQRGDTLYAIAKLFNVSVEDILAYNTIANPASLTIGQTLRIPTGDVTYVEYVVQRGDLLVTIAQRFGVSVEDILAINDIRNPSSLTVGQTLRIPRRLP